MSGSHGLVSKQRYERDGVEEVFAQLVLCLQNTHTALWKRLPRIEEWSALNASNYRGNSIYIDVEFTQHRERMT